ncbi:hypothetical protein niasHT_021453 [Heterodera trifolii]|uniref:CYRIA/CYRIB Rac1 binding domain-containing protein n=1 Tax=Heterodera trifolii TaxID=157864 RepID=A0ABD2KIN1_9BILA
MTTSIGLNDRVSIQDVFYSVQALEELQIGDDLPSIGANSQSLQYRVSFDTNFEDRSAFITGCSKFIEEATKHAEFNELLREGFTHAANLYTWRCCSRAVPMPRSNDQLNRAEINEKIVQVLEPEVRKLDNFMHFALSAVDRFCEEFHSLCHPEKRKDFVSESLLLLLGQLLNMFLVLDALKDMKASIKNDLSTFRRASQFFTNDSNNLIWFVATQNKIKQSLRERIQKIEAHEELLADLINISAHFHENRMFISPDQRHTHIKVIAFCLYLMDAEVYTRLDQKKRISIQKFDKIFNSIEVVPLFGDMNILPFSFVKQCRNTGQCVKGTGQQCKCYDPAKWPLSNSESEKCHVDIVQRLPLIRQQHGEFVTQLSRIRNEISVYNRIGPSNDGENREMAHLALSGLQLLCAWTCDVVETVAWKLLNPTNQRRNPECPDNAETYELATKYNYTGQEKAAIIEVISMAKGVQSLMVNMDTDFAVAIRQHIYAELQDFVGGPLRDLLAKAVKHKKDILTGVISSIMETCSDQSANSGGIADHRPLNKFNSRSSDLSSSMRSLGGGGGKKSKKGGADTGSMPDLRGRRRSVVPSSTQLYLARTMLESLVHEKSSSTGRRIYRKDLDEKYREKMVHFLRQSYFWPALLDLKQSLDESVNLSQLWFREFYLEMAMGNRIQFPIDMSMPWMLTDHILTTLDPSLLECVLHQLDLYNDAAAFALGHFRKQFLYDEVEAEVNLCFDQFVYKLSEAVFAHYKQRAATMLLDKGFKEDCARYGIAIFMPNSVRFETLLRQRHVQLLGRSIDLNRLISQRINAALLRSLDVAISKFEADGLNCIMVLDNLIEVNRLCHRLLSDHLGSLADFNDLLLEANRQVSAPNGRITLHAFAQLTDDVLVNFCFNTATRRFVRGKLNYRKPSRGRPPAVAAQYEFGSKSLNSSFSNLSMMYGGFVGVPHFRVVAKLVGYQGISAILFDLLGLAQRLLNDQIKAHFRSLLALMPKMCKLQRFEYGVEGNLQYFIHQLRDFSAYGPLRRECCQSLRELGNVLAVALLMELGMAQEEMFDVFAAAAFTNQIPKPYAKNLEDQAIKMHKLESKYSRLQIGKIVHQFGTETQAKIALDSAVLTSERLSCGLRIFDMVLIRLHDTLLTDPIWRGPVPTNGVMWVDECHEFHRIWSAFQLALSLVHVQTHGLSHQTSAIGSASSSLSSMENVYGTLKKGGGPSAPIGANVTLDSGGASTAAQQQQQQGTTIEELFGDGIYWAGCAIVRLLGQHRRFEVLDFSYHLLRVNRAVGSAPNQQQQQHGTTAGTKEGGSGNKAQQQQQQQQRNIARLIDRIRRVQAQHNQVFALLGNFCVHLEEQEQKIRHFAPPVYQPQQNPYANGHEGIAL